MDIAQPGQATDPGRSNPRKQALYGAGTYILLWQNMPSLM